MVRIDLLEQGPCSERFTFVLTKGMREELETWAEVAGWPIARTIRYLLALAIRTFDADMARDSVIIQEEAPQDD